MRTKWPALIAVFLSALCAGCVCRSGGARAEPRHVPPPPPSVTWFNFVGGHPVPVALGGGWDATPGMHAHNYGPDPIGGYRQEGQSWRWVGDMGARGEEYRNAMPTPTPPPSPQPGGTGTSTTREGPPPRP